MSWKTATRPSTMLGLSNKATQESNMASILEANYGPPLNWKSTEENKPRPTALHVILHKREYVFPWSRFIYAEGSNDSVTISFPTHQVVVTGYGLDHFLS